MAAAPINIKLRCASWQQLANIYKRDLARHAVFLKSSNPPPLGTAVRIGLTLPTESIIVLTGTVSEHVAPGGLGGRGPGVDIKLNTIPQSALWLIETALASAQKQAGPLTTAAPAPAAAPEGASPPSTTAATWPPPRTSCSRPWARSWPRSAASTRSRSSASATRPPTTRSAAASQSLREQPRGHASRVARGRPRPGRQPRRGLLLSNSQRRRRGKVGDEERPGEVLADTGEILASEDVTDR